jgi:predicted O-methyltransferase YrrM
MDFLSPDLNQYVESHTAVEPEVLRKLNRETNAKVVAPRMLSGHLQGRMLSMFSHMIKPNQILEIGTYTGYSAICFADGLQPGGMIHTIDINDELEEMVRRYFNEAGLESKIKLYIGDALKIIPSIHSTFDLVFIDADKINYSRYYDLVFDKVRPGGYILADNVLWSGKVLEDKSEMDDDTKAIVEFNRKVHNDSRVEHVLLPVRDGVMLIRKKI